jgi:HlyD family secretion protein
MHHVFGWLKFLKYPAILVVASLVFWYVRNLPVDVVDHSVTRGTVIRSVMGTGTLEARIRTTVSPKISG